MASGGSVVARMPYWLENASIAAASMASWSVASLLAVRLWRDVTWLSPRTLATQWRCLP
jgi:hypothetical protein